MSKTNDVIFFQQKSKIHEAHRNRLTNYHLSATSEDITGVQTLVKKSLNWMTSKRLISIQEAVHEIDRLELVLCSDVITTVSLQSCLYKLKRKDEPDPKNLVYTYATRGDEHKDMSLDTFFYKVWRKNNIYDDPDSKRPLKRILIPRGLNCRPRHPIDFDYARGMLIMHKPWSFNNPLNTRNEQATIDEFKRMLENRDVPMSVWTEYMRAVKYSQESRIEVLAKKGILDADVNMDEMTSDEKDQHTSFLHSSHFSASNTDPLLTKENVVNIGLDHDWSVGFFEGTREETVSGDEYIKQLRDKKSSTQTGENEPLSIPKKSTGESYSIDSLSDEQLVIVLATIDSVVKFLTNDSNYKPLRATIIGMGGCGKSLVINTIIGIIREMTKTNKSVLVAAPSGNAAWNVKGCTLHSLLGINVKCPWRSLDDDRKEALGQKLKELLVLMVDERSMLNSHVTFGAEEHARECAFNGHNRRERWGGIPVVLLFGDDYQLPPVDKKGAIHGYSKFNRQNRPSTMTYSSKNAQICEYEGWHILGEMMTDNVFKLTKNFRTKDEEDSQLMSRMREGNQTYEDAERLWNLHLTNYSASFRAELEDDPKTLFAFAKREPMRNKNTELLVQTHKRNKVPVARLKCHYESNKKNGNTTIYNSHFKSMKIQHQLDVCVGAKVCLETANIDPIAGLFVGAIGTVVDIVYDKSVGPNGDLKEHLPKFIVVDFPSFKPSEGFDVWDKNNPTVSVAIISIVLERLLPLYISQQKCSPTSNSSARANHTLQNDMRQAMLLSNFHATSNCVRNNNPQMSRPRGWLRRR